MADEDDEVIVPWDDDDTASQPAVDVEGEDDVDVGRHHSPVAVHERSRWGRSCLAGLVVFSLVVGSLGAVAYVFGYRKLFPASPHGGEVEVVVPEGVGVSAVADILETKGVIASAALFRAYVRLRAGDLNVQKGAYTFRRGSSATQTIEVLRRGPRPPESLRFTVPEAFTIARMKDVVGSIQGLSGERFAQLATGGEIRWSEQPTGVGTLEGLLFPDTYEVRRAGLTEDSVVRRMLARFQEVWGSLDKRRLGEFGLTPYEAVIVASLVEAEAKVPEDRPIIASVIYNRLREGIPLAIDATILYVIGHKDVVLFEDLEIDSPYNTYKNAGLPPTPIAAPGRKSLEAALNPAETRFLYYVLCEKDGRHCFAETIEGHNANIARAERNGLR